MKEDRDTPLDVKVRAMEGVINAPKNLKLAVDEKSVLLK